MMILSPVKARCTGESEVEHAVKTLPTNKIDLASRWRPQPAVGGPSQPRRVAKFLFKIQCPSQPLAAPASCIRMLHSSCSKSSAPHLAFASARLMALRRLVAVLPTSSQYPPNLFPTSSLFLSISFFLTQRIMNDGRTLAISTLAWCV